MMRSRPAMFVRYVLPWSRVEGAQPSQRTIVIKRAAWIRIGASVIPGVTVGGNAMGAVTPSSSKTSSPTRSLAVYPRRRSETRDDEQSLQDRLHFGAQVHGSSEYSALRSACCTSTPLDVRHFGGHSLPRERRSSSKPGGGTTMPCVRIRASTTARRSSSNSTTS
jgi:hypothetical protein